MAEFEFLKSIVIIFGLSGIVVFLLDRLRVPSIIGFLVAGILLGPHGLKLITDIHLVKTFAEIGVILLLFTIGLEFSLKNLLTLKRTILLGGFLQIAITSIVVFIIGYSSGYGVSTSVIFAFLVSMSSTAIVMKMLFERAEIDSPQGRASFGILIFQDLCVVLFILMIPILSGTHSELTGIAGVLLKSLIIIIAIIISARWVVPKALHQIVHTRKREIFVISIIFICLGAAFLTSRLGLSLAIGAFIAGLVISESEYSYQAIADILPFKDSFIGLFFISVGMLMDIGLFLRDLPLMGLTVTAILLIKILATTAALYLLGSNIRISLQSALILAQIGEFSFVLSTAALKAGIIDEGAYQIFLSSAVITMALTPVLINISPRVSTWITSRSIISRLQRMRQRERLTPPAVKKTDHVIIVGFGLNGRNLAIVLKELEVPYRILEMNSDTVRRMRKEGEPIYYGDGTSPEILHKMGVERARVLVIAISDPTATRRIVRIAREMNRGIYIIVRTRYIVEVEDLLSLGADEVIPEEFETSIELFSRVLEFYQMPTPLISRYAEKFRSDHYRLFIKGEIPKRIFHDTVALMPDIDYESFIVEAGSKAVGSSMKELDIRNRTGAHVIAIRHENKMIFGPSPNLAFKEGDMVFVIGDADSLKRANTLFSGDDE